MPAINHERLTAADRVALDQASGLADQAAMLLHLNGFSRFHAARDRNLTACDPRDPAARFFSIEGAIERIRKATSRSVESEAWVHRAYRVLIGDTCFVDNDRHSKISAVNALRACSALLREWSLAAGKGD